MNLVERAKNILLQPKPEWPVIAAETTAIADLYEDYIVPLAAIPAVAAFVGLTMFGITLPETGLTRIPVGAALSYAVANFLLTLGAVYLMALIINALAPTFGGEKNLPQALKLVAFASTASWLAGIFAIIPLLSILSVLGLYSLYLLYLGLPVMMKSPAEKALGYTTLVVVCAIGVFMVIGLVSSAFIAVAPA